MPGESPGPRSRWQSKVWMSEHWKVRPGSVPLQVPHLPQLWHVWRWSFVKPLKEGAGLNWALGPVPTPPWVRAWQLASFPPAHAQEIKRPSYEALPTTYTVESVNAWAASSKNSSFWGASSPKARLQNSWVSYYLRNSLENPAGIKLSTQRASCPPGLQGLCISCHLMVALARDGLTELYPGLS